MFNVDLKFYICRRKCKTSNQHCFTLHDYLTLSDIWQFHYLSEYTAVH